MRSVEFLTCAGLLLASFVLPMFAQEPTKISPAAELVAAKRVLIIAHRGASKHAPENTLPAFEAALKTKCDLIELDYYHSADKVPVVFHDKDLDRTTNAPAVLGKTKLELDEVTLADLQRLDAGTWFKPQFAGAKVPTLVESLNLIQSGSMTLIERKAGDAETIVKLLDEKKLRGNVIIQAFDWKYIAACHQIAPDLVLGCLGSKELNAKRIAEAKQAGAAAIGWKHDDLNAENIAAVHSAGLKCWAYTVNDRRRGKQLLDAGIDGLITDDPAYMQGLLAMKK
jgi:glycerophosphoryl diester phosphodiesterase